MADPNDIPDTEQLFEEVADPLDEAFGDPLTDELSDLTADDATEPVAGEAPQKPEPEPEAETTPSTPAGPKKPWFDVYTALLAFTLLATMVASLFLALELARYDWQTKPGPMPTAADAP